METCGERKRPPPPEKLPFDIRKEESESTKRLVASDSGTTELQWSAYSEEEEEVEKQARRRRRRESGIKAMEFLQREQSNELTPTAA